MAWLPLTPSCYDPANNDSVVTKKEFTDAGYNFFSGQLPMVAC